MIVYIHCSLSRWWLSGSYYHRPKSIWFCWYHIWDAFLHLLKYGKKTQVLKIKFKEKYWNFRKYSHYSATFEYFIFKGYKNKCAEWTALEEYVLKMVLEVRNDLLFSELRPLKVMNKLEKSEKISKINEIYIFIYI